jgi:transcriptional regulator with XRE-family HTH domain
MTEQNLPNVGQRIREIREAKGLSLRALAARSGLSLNAISLIERGENSPTVSSLHLLATALGVSIADFFQGALEQTVIFVEPAARLRAEANGITLESQGSGLRQQKLEPFVLSISPGAGNVDQPISHPGEEFVYCLEGSVDYSVGSRTYALQKGYSLLFEASMPHCFCNPAGEPASLLIVFYGGGSRQLVRRLHLESTPVEH